MALLSLGIFAALGSLAGPPPIHAHAGPADEDNTRIILAALLAPQEEHPAEGEDASAEHAESAAEEHSVLDEIFHWANFLILLGGLWFLVRKYLVPFLEERGRLIREDMDRSAKVLAEADQRMSAVEAKLKNLDAEMASLRQSAFQETTAERARIEEMSKTDANKILATAEQEIEAAVKAARQELKAYTSELALGVAEKKIRDSLTPQAEERILRSFFHELSGNGDRAGDSGAASGTGTPTQAKEN